MRKVSISSSGAKVDEGRVDRGKSTREISLHDFNVADGHVGHTTFRPILILMVFGDRNTSNDEWGMGLTYETGSLLFRKMTRMMKQSWNWSGQAIWTLMPVLNRIHPSTSSPFWYRLCRRWSSSDVRSGSLILFRVREDRFLYQWRDRSEERFKNSTLLEILDFVQVERGEEKSSEVKGGNHERRGKSALQTLLQAETSYIWLRILF